MSGLTQPAADILVLEDDDSLRELLLEELNDAGYSCQGVANLASARHWLDRGWPQLVLSDLRLPDGSGLEMLRWVKQLAGPPACILITAFGTIDQAVDALKQGADDFLTKPLDLEHLRLSVQRTLQTQQLRQEVAWYREWVNNGDFHGMIGRCTPMRRLFTQIKQVAHADGPVLITGESGVGKELVARALHAESARARKPFVAVNCGGIPAALLESELFGHVAGAFTGASKARTGLFAAADGGTLLLDEIGELPLEMQSTLLRILQDGCVRPVGSNQEQTLDVRIFAATNRDLTREVTEGGFREDLYYRLETFTLEIPPLRQRGDDLELLTAHLIGHYGKRVQSPANTILPAALTCLRQYSFPGNVRELANIIERAVTFCRDTAIDLEHLPDRVREPAPAASGLKAPGVWSLTTASGTELVPLAEVERAYVQHVLHQVDGNKRQAADILGIGRRTLYRWLDRE